MMECADDLTCAQLVELVTEYLEDALTPKDRAIFDDHLLGCEDCASYLDQMRTTIEVTGRLREDHLSPEMTAALVEAFRGWRANLPG